MVTVLPSPGVLSILTLPRNDSIERLTTSIPTPRPETFETTFAVEKPASNIRLYNSCGVGVESVVNTPRSMAFKRIA